MARCDWWILVRLCLINFVIGLLLCVSSFAKRGEEEGSAFTLKDSAAHVVLVSCICDVFVF